MNRKRKTALAVGFYLLNALAVFLLIGLAGLTTNVKILLATWLVILTGIVSYATAKTYRR